MKINAQVKNIVQANERGTIMLNEITADGKPGKTIAIQFKEPKEAAEFVYGEEYEIAITKKKK